MENKGIFEFGQYRLNAVQRVLHRAGVPVLITPKAFEVLLVLVKNSGQVVSKEDLMHEVWPGTFVEANNLAFNISLLRKALGENGGVPSYIETVPKRGYRFVAGVRDLSINNGSLPLPVAPEMLPSEMPPKAPFWPRFSGVALAFILVAVLTIGAMKWIRRGQVLHQIEPKVRQLTTNNEDNPIEHAVISPDGKYLAYGDSAGIQIRLIETGESHLLPRPQSLSTGDFWFPAAWCPDGSRLVATAITSKTSMAWSVALIGGGSALLRENASARSIAPDGSMIAFLTVPANHAENLLNRHLIRAAEIWVMGPNGENARKILATDSLTYIGSVRWSSNGKRLAFQHFRREGAAGIIYSIDTIDLNGSSRSTIFERTHYASVSVDRNFPEDFFWLRDDRIVYALREPTPALRDSNLWAVKVAEISGKRSGEPERLTKLAGFHMEGISATGDGKRITFESGSDQSYVYVAKLSTNDKLLDGQRLTPDERYNTPYVWTPDSKAVLFRSDRTGRFALYKQALDRQVPDLISTGPGSPEYPRLSPDGRWVVYAIGEYPKHDRLMRVLLAGGPPQLIFEHIDSELYDCPHLSGLPCLMLGASSDGKQDVFFNFDPLTGARWEAFRTARKTTSMVLSPNGSLVSTIGTDPAGAIEIRSRSGEIKRTIRIDGWPNPVTHDWAADSKTLFVSHPGLTQSPSGPIGATVLHVDFNGHAKPIWDIRGGRYAFAIQSPDGKYLALRGATIGRNAWLLEGF